MVQAELFEAWSELLRYPAEGGARRIRARIDEIRSAVPELETDLRPLFDYSRSHGETELEETFTRTFDGNAERALEVGWHLHGENYARGAFMVRMRQLLREHGVEEHGELPDHLSHVLPVMARAERDLASALASGVLAPALKKIAAGFSDRNNPYRGVITSLVRFIELEYGQAPEVPPHA